MSQSKRYKTVFLSLLFLHKAKQLGRSLLLGILFDCSFVHKQKQRALSFSRSGPSVDKQWGLRHTGGFRRRAHKRPDSMAASCRDQRRVSEGGATLWIITWSLAQTACVSVPRSRPRMRFHSRGRVAVRLALWCIFNTAAWIRAATNILLSYGYAFSIS